MDTENKSPEEIVKMLEELAQESPMLKFQKALQESRKARIDKQRLRYEMNWPVVEQIKTGKIKTDKKGQKYEVVVPVRQFIGWGDRKKYTGEKLREIRKQQTLKAIEGQTHYADGTPIIRDRLVDLQEAA